MSLSARPHPCFGWGDPYDNDELGLPSCPNLALPEIDYCAECLARIEAEVESEPQVQADIRASS